MSHSKNAPAPAGSKSVSNCEQSTANPVAGARSDKQTDTGRYRISKRKISNDWHWQKVLFPMYAGDFTRQYPPTTQPLENLYGKRPLELAIITKITVPCYVPRNSSKITRSQLFDALSHYILVDFEEFSSKTHIPLGVEVTVEYGDGAHLGVNMFGGMSYTAELYRQDGVSRYGLQRISEPDPPANSEKSPS